MNKVGPDALAHYGIELDKAKGEAGKQGAVSRVTLMAESPVATTRRDDVSGTGTGAAHEQGPQDDDEGLHL
jgi:hypothetical protein